MENLILFGMPVIATVAALIIFRSRGIAIVSAIAVSELVLLAYLAQDRSGWGGIIFLGFSPILIGACLLVAVVAHIFSTFPARDRVILMACAIAHLVITNLVFEWSYQWHNNNFMSAAFAHEPLPPSPFGLELVDGAMKLLSVPVILGIAALFNEPLQNFPRVHVFILATINSIFVAYGCVVALRMLRK